LLRNSVSAKAVFAEISGWFQMLIAIWAVIVDRRVSLVVGKRGKPGAYLSISKCIHSGYTAMYSTQLAPLAPYGTVGKLAAPVLQMGYASLREGHNRNYVPAS
jgi:hypothetical protein